MFSRKQLLVTASLRCNERNVYWDEQSINVCVRRTYNLNIAAVSSSFVGSTLSWSKRDIISSSATGATVCANISTAFSLSVNAARRQNSLQSQHVSLKKENKLLSFTRPLMRVVCNWWAMHQHTTRGDREDGASPHPP